MLALNPSGPVDGTAETGGGFITTGMQTRSTLFGTGAAGLYTLTTQWTARGDLPGTLNPNWMHYYHGVTVEIVRVDKSTLRSALNTAIGTTMKTMTGASNVTTIVTANGADPTSGGITNANKGKNPQSWYYTAGWNLFSTAYENAWKTIDQPSATQLLIDTAVNNGTGAYTSLVLKGANYTDRTSQYLTAGLGNTFYNSTVSPLGTIVTAIQNSDATFNPKLRLWKDGQYNNYTDESRLALEEAYTAATDCQATNYNVIYQLYVDYCAQQLQAAVNGLVFKPNTITFDPNYGDGTMDTQTFSAGSSENLIANTFTKTGYTFAGWAISPESDVLYANGASYMMGDSDITLFAKWAANTYTVVYNGNGHTGGITINSVHTYDVEKALNINGFTRTGYTFTGWGLAPTSTVISYANQESVTNLISQPNGGSITLYAMWIPSNYNIAFNANGGVGTMSNQTFAYLQSDTLKANNFTLLGNTFKGWATTQANANAGIVAYADGASYTMSTPESKILYAAWNASTYAINFNANAADATGTMPSQNLAFGQTASLNSNTFSRTGYSLLGWANSPTGAKAFNNGASFTMNTEGANLYAKWDPIVYTVGYSANGGSSAPAPNSAVYDVSFI
ncbi:MAG: InlB B-repeat-containing protein [Eubacteriales bacterium]